MAHDSAVAGLLAALERSDGSGTAAFLGVRAHLVHDAGDASGGEARGRMRVARQLLGIRKRFPDAVVRPARVNGAPGGVIRTPEGRVVAVIAAEGGRRIRSVWVTTAPLKLARWN